jgi:hypothetical protein
LQRSEELRRLAKLREIECVDYPSTQSFVKDGAFIQVWNEGTPAWKSIASTYHAFLLPSLRDKARELPMSHRGNRSLSVGFTGQSHRRDEITCVQKPILCTDTKYWDEEMASLSLLLKVCDGAPPDSDYSRQRKVDFADLIHRDNILEGFTPCITNVSTQEVHCHLDCHNDQLAHGFGVVIVASEIKNGERYAGVGYFKNACASYYRRLIFMKDWIGFDKRSPMLTFLLLKTRQYVDFVAAECVWIKLPTTLHTCTYFVVSSKRVD